MKVYRSMLILCVLLILAGSAMPADSTMARDSMEHKMGGQMPPMGPPEQMKDLAFLVGDWDVTGQMRMGPDQPWQDYTGTSNYHYDCDGAVMASRYESAMMGMKYIGIGFQTYDREDKQWQMTWTDNMSGRMAMYTGYRKNGKTVMVGEDKWMGKTFLTRMTIYDETDSSYQWMMEHSMDGGQNWYTSMKAEYKKK